MYCAKVSFLFSLTHQAKTSSFFFSKILTLFNTQKIVFWLQFDDFFLLFSTFLQSSTSFCHFFEKFYQKNALLPVL